MPVSKVKVKYEKSYDFKVALTTGIYGGIGSNGLIQANFFVDRIVLPSSQVISIDEKGIQVEQSVDEKDGDLLREIQFGAFMDINTAKIVGDWFLARVKE